jgi:NDP-sugar pyrophosphorylase family protein
LQIALVVDGDDRLLGTVTDGDVRRGILHGVSLEDCALRVMNPAPTVASDTDACSHRLMLMQSRSIRHLPLLNEAGKLVGMDVLADLLKPPRRDNLVLLMAGGLGTRLSPLTDRCPKPMLPVANRPMLEIILQNFIQHGFHRFYISVHYKASAITEYFGDGARWDVSIDYIHERKPLGTAGALALLPEPPTEAMLVTNGDVLSTLNLSQLLDFHLRERALATMCVREYEFQVPYGVIRLNGHEVLAIEEKPVQRHFVNAGIYALEPEAAQLAPRDCYFDMTTRFATLVDRQKPVAVFPVREYWMDVGRHADLQKVNGDYRQVFR